ncbi:ATP-binding protein [Pseudonocardia sp.]|uniref:ATP-binding protein n=1 Tax=Pseudonocardia sp. TaxID=60912 RepID=UPI00261E3385|nr:ATP-binding protein [Pseudonocardia sp.]
MTTPPVRLGGFAALAAGHPQVVTESKGGSRPLRLCHPAEPGELRAIRHRVDWWARDAGLPDGMVIDLQLALGEAVANGVEHAYRTDPDTGQVGVDLELGAGPEPAVSVRVTDHGTWHSMPDDPGNRGRGLLMIERLARRVRVIGTPRGTEVLFEIPFSA